MKRILTVLLLSLSCIMFSHCGVPPEQSQTGRMILIEYHVIPHHRIWYDRETKVMYITGDGTKVFTPLVDAEGKPVLYYKN